MEESRPTGAGWSDLSDEFDEFIKRLKNNIAWLLLALPIFRLQTRKRVSKCLKFISIGERIAYTLNLVCEASKRRAICAFSNVGDGDVNVRSLTGRDNLSSPPAQESEEGLSALSPIAATGNRE
jgi:hypothetical protein